MTLEAAKEAVIKAACAVVDYDWRSQEHPATGVNNLEDAVREYRKVQRVLTPPDRPGTFDPVEKK